MKKFIILIPILLTAILLIFLYSGQAEKVITYPDGKWEVSTTHTFDEKRREGLYHALEKRPQIHTMLIIKDGKIIEDYGVGIDNNNTIKEINSATKSIMSMLIGIAIGEGHIESVHQSIEYFIPEIKEKDTYEDLKKITIRDLLTMRSGIKWGTRNEEMTGAVSDPIDYFISQPIDREPDRIFVYNTGGSDLLSVIIERATGMPTPNYAEEKLFNPLKIEKYTWNQFNGGFYRGGRGIALSPYDMAKIGYLMLQDGIWEGERIIPEGWGEESTAKYSNGDYFLAKGYGYQWVIGSHGREDYYFAAGALGQYIFVIPSNNLVVVFTGRFPDEEYPVHYALLRNYIIDYID